MPDCTAEQQAYNLAVATEAVRYAQMLVESAEAQLAQYAYYQAMSARSLAYGALQTCLMGNSGGYKMADKPMSSEEKHLRATIASAQMVWQERLRAYNELVDSPVK